MKDDDNGPGSVDGKSSMTEDSSKQCDLDADLDFLVSSEAGTPYRKGDNNLQVYYAELLPNPFRTIKNPFKTATNPFKTATKREIAANRLKTKVILKIIS